MKPNFALSLSADSIRLLLRAAGGWRLVGEVSPSSDTLGSELAALRKTASDLAPDGVRCKVVIPNEQIRYLSIDTPNMGVSQRRDAALLALDGATPYTLDELAVDVCPDGEVSHIAAVAHETLEEAEAFVQEHRFHPVCFVATPLENAFLGEPYFGPSKAARGLLEEGTTVEPDGVAIVVIGDVPVPEGPIVDTQPAQTTTSDTFSSSPSDVPHIAFADHRSDEAERENRLSDALESLRKAPEPVMDVTSPYLPAREAATSTPAFASRRRRGDDQNDRFPRPSDADHAPIGGFAEPDPEPLTPKAQSMRTPPRPAPQMTFADEAERLTVFGARSQASPTRTPRQLTSAIAIAVAVVSIGLGAFASGILPSSFSGIFDREARAAAENTAVEVAPPLLPSVPAKPPATDENTVVASLEPSLTDEDAAVLDALRAHPFSQQNNDAPQTPDDFRANYAVTGIWPLAPDVPNPSPLVDLEDLYVTSIDRIEPAFDAVALPQPEEVNRDVVIDTPSSPAAAGTAFALDERGLVIGSKQGTLSPDGVKIFAGAPPVRPTNLPLRVTPSQIAKINPALARLASFRPRLRPNDIVETTERATLDGLTRSELAEIRPPIRPAPPDAARADASAASLVPLDDSTPTEAVANTRLASVVTKRPDVRPSNFDQIIARTQKAAASAATAGAASIAPRAVVKPKIPSSASVAREATVRNAINLRKVNLIGVYGSPSQRRALVRLSNGRYKKVEVGDRIDGGRISAIGEGELRYQKSGRNIILKMPKG